MLFHTPPKLHHMPGKDMIKNQAIIYRRLITDGKELMTDTSSQRTFFAGQIDDNWSGLHLRGMGGGTCPP